LPKPVRDALGPFEEGQKTGEAGRHAELKGMDMAKGLEIFGIGASKPVCARVCQGPLNAAGITYFPKGPEKK
jgi:hypothetical protein